VRTARRSELLRILSRQQRLPEVELLDAEVAVAIVQETVVVSVRLALYVVPLEPRVVIPFHRCSLEVAFGPADTLRFRAFTMGPVGGEESPTAAATGTEIVLNGPCQVDVYSLERVAEPPSLEANATVVLKVAPTLHDGTLSVVVPLRSQDRHWWWPENIPPECQRYTRR
jgi:hypothetical protein